MFYFLYKTGFEFIALRECRFAPFSESEKQSFLPNQSAKLLWYFLRKYWGLVKMGIFIYYSK